MKNSAVVQLFRSGEETLRIVACAVAVLSLGCSGAPRRESPGAATPSPLPAATTAASDGSDSAGWRPLSDGRTLAGWRGYRATDVPAGWKVTDGVITKETSTDDIVTRDRFGDFELQLEWKLAPGGNSGIFYRGTEEYDHIYWSAPEYQLLDDAGAPDGANRLTSAGAAYGLYPPPAGVVKAAGEWNSTRIVVRGAHVEHWLNGRKLLEYELWSPDWEARVKASKFSDWPNYGKAPSGYIALQGDHNGALSLRNIRIRELR
ncbi:MAG: DUF1080 domain-containing protein [Gemmatimonadota bacterium]|nr:DUF1080 domain-containing protein [Gemmatimonadota bacterium]